MTAGGKIGKISETAAPRPQPIMPITVAEDAYDWPLFVTFEGRELMVETIDQQWRIDAETWEHKPVNRIHYRVTLEDGRSLEVFKNMDHGSGIPWPAGG